jgi:GxxExxY protein
MKTPSIATINRISHEVIGAAIELHRELGPGLLESAYRECLAREFTLRGIPFEREKPIRLEYKGIALEVGYRLDFLVAECLVIELAIEALAPVHDAQLITYLRLGGWRLGLLINFNVPVLKNGIHRRIFGYETDQRAAVPEETHHDN